MGLTFLLSMIATGSKLAVTCSIMASDSFHEIWSALISRTEILYAEITMIPRNVPTASPVLI